MERDQVQERPELHEESQSSHVEDEKTVGISDEGDERNATASNDSSAAREPWMSSSAIEEQPGHSVNGTSTGADEDDELSSVSSEGFSEWRQFWTLLSPIPDGVEDFR